MVRMWRWDGARALLKSFDTAPGLVGMVSSGYFTRRRGALSIYLQCPSFPALTLFSVNRQSYASIWIGFLVYITLGWAIKLEPLSRRHRRRAHTTADEGKNLYFLLLIKLLSCRSSPQKLHISRRISPC